MSTIKEYSTTKGVVKTSAYVITQSVCIYTFLTNSNISFFHNYLIASFFGIIVSDFVAGFVHWGLDHYRGLDPVAIFFLGEPFVSQYSVHHQKPHLLRQQNFWATNSDGLFATSVVLGLIYYIMHRWYSFNTRYSSSFLLFMIIYCIWTAFTNQFHKWSHTPKNELPFFVPWLQKIGLALTKQEHERHHQNNSVAYCLTTGSCNKVLEWIGFWKGVKHIVEKFPSK